MTAANPTSSAFRTAASVRRPGFDPFSAGAALLRRMPANFAHRAAIQALKHGLVPGDRSPDDDVLRIRLWDLDFANPIGMAAGFDKDAEAVDGLLGLGFGFVEAGTVTPLPQPGNPRPNLFRLPDDRALINRLGFPSRGLDTFARNLADRREHGGIVAANIGINTGTEDAIGDVVTGVRHLAPVAAYLVVNVSCPNTPGLCVWQEGDRLSAMLKDVVGARDHVARAGKRRTPILVKLSPDLDGDQLAAAAAAAVGAGIDGLIATNTTAARPSGLHGAAVDEAGGLSGPALFAPATAALSALYRLTGGKLPIIGCGGVSSGSDAYAKIRAGASLVQFYTALIYHGPRLVRTIKDDLAARLRADGYARIQDAVGADHH